MQAASQIRLTVMLMYNAKDRRGLCRVPPNNAPVSGALGCGTGRRGTHRRESQLYSPPPRTEKTQIKRIFIKYEYCERIRGSHRLLCQMASYSPATRANCYASRCWRLSFRASYLLAGKPPAATSSGVRGGSD